MEIPCKGKSLIRGPRGPLLRAPALASGTRRPGPRVIKVHSKTVFAHHVKPSYKRFPIESSLETNTAGVYNYLDLKTRFYI